MTLTLLMLFLAPPIIAVAYALLEHGGVLDQLFGRKAAQEGLLRLKSTAGYPVSILYDDAADQPMFNALERRISKRVPIEATKGSLRKPAKPTCITIVGKAIPIKGVPEQWPQELRFSYFPNHSILYGFGATRAKGGGQAIRVCTLGEIEKWLAEEKEARKHWVGAVALGLISIAFIVVRSGVTSQLCGQG
ncbi:MAG: hypothetical protein B7X93_04910 [Hydrogenophilales bacterium 17-61-9]|nr:MAG: hypothetical protein B7X93_04910 [Hydrogenophilales bacterium 17-61-9]